MRSLGYPLMTIIYKPKSIFTGFFNHNSVCENIKQIIYFIWLEFISLLELIFSAYFIESFKSILAFSKTLRAYSPFEIGNKKIIKKNWFTKKALNLKPKLSLASYLTEFYFSFNVKDDDDLIYKKFKFWILFFIFL